MVVVVVEVLDVAVVEAYRAKDVEDVWKRRVNTRAGRQRRLGVGVKAQREPSVVAVFMRRRVIGLLVERGNETPFPFEGRCNPNSERF